MKIVVEIHIAETTDADQSKAVPPPAEPQLTAAQVKEYEAEGGVVSNKQADGSASVVELTSSGVLMRGRKK